jgi:hypothetical protein
MAPSELGEGPRIVGCQAVAGKPGSVCPQLLHIAFGYFVRRFNKFCDFLGAERDPMVDSITQRGRTLSSVL